MPPADTDRPLINTSPDLLHEARAGCPRALGQTLDGYRTELLAAARRQLPSRLRAKGDASDIVQQTFFDAFVHFEGFRGVTLTELSAWLRKLLTNRLAKFARAYRTQRRCEAREVPLSHPAGDVVTGLEGPSAVLEPAQAALRLEAVKAVQEALRRLSDPARIVIELRHWERLSFAEVARRTGRTEAAVRKAWTRSLDHMRAQLGNGHRPAG